MPLAIVNAPQPAVCQLTVPALATKLPVPDTCRFPLAVPKPVMVTSVNPTAGETVALLVKLFVGTAVEAYIVIPFVVLGSTMVLKPLSGTLGKAMVKLPPVAELSVPMVSV